MSRPRPKILVVRGGAIGDFVLTLPVFAALREQFPDTRLEVLGYPHIAQLALAGGLVDAVQPIEARGLASFFVAEGELPPEWVTYFASFALIISYLYDPDEIFRANVARCTRAQFIAAPHRPEPGVRRHATEVYLKPLERLAIFEPDPLPCLCLKPAPEAPEASDGCWLAAHPGSGSEAKNWPETHWASLLVRLAAHTSWRLLLVGGEAEGDRLRRLAALWPADRLALAQSLPLADLARRLSRCAWFLGHDSGITHLAAALGLPSLVIWGDTDEAVWRPGGTTVRLLRARGGLRALLVEQVWTALHDLAAAEKNA